MSIVYWCVAESDKLEALLKSYHSTLSEMKADKQTIIDAVTGVEETAYLMMYYWTDNICGRNGYVVDPTYTEPVDQGYVKYIAKVQKSVDAKQSHALVLMNRVRV